MVRARTIAYVLYHGLQSLEERKYETFAGRVEKFAESRGIASLLPQAYVYLHRMVLDSDEVLGAHVETAHEISKKLLKDIVEYAGAEDVSVRHNIDPEILGGFRVSHNYRLHDATLANQLEKLI